MRVFIWRVVWSCALTLPLGSSPCKGTTPGPLSFPKERVRVFVFPMELMSAVESAAIVDLTTLRQWSGLSDEAWNAVSARLGNVPNLRILALIPPRAVREAIVAARVAVPAVGEADAEDHEPATTRALTAVESAQMGLTVQGAQHKTGRTVVDPLEEGPAGLPPGGVPLLTTAPFPPAPSGSTGATGETKRKVKCNQVVDQTDEAEVPELKQKDLDGFYAQLKKVKGGPVRPECEPSPDQISALKVRVLDLELSPYADFAIFVNFQHRFFKTLKFLNHVLQADGSFKAIEVPGPPSYDHWLTSWRVFENTLLMFEHEVTVGHKVPVVTQASLEEYRDTFRDMVVNYPEAWHLLVVAEDRCRCEHFPRLKRECQDKSDKGQLPDFVAEQPWDYVFRAAARDRDYWDRNVREPAILFRTAGGKKKEQPGGTGSLTDLTDDTVKAKKKAKKASQRERLKRQVLRLKENQGDGAKPDVKGKGPKRDSKGRFLTDRQGRPICFAFNNGECKDVCPKQMVHLCQTCLGSHPAKQCRKGAGTDN